LIAVSPNFPGTKTARVISFLRAYKRIIVFSLVVACSALILVHPNEWGLFFGFLAMLIASQLFWIRRALDVGERFVPGRPRRTWLAIIAAVVYVSFFAYSFAHLGVFHQLTMGHRPRAADPRLCSILIDGIVSWWLFGSLVGFALLMVFWTIHGATDAAAWVYRRVAGHASTLKPGAIDPLLLARRRFLKQTAVVVSATPFVAGIYGLLYGRLDVEVTRQRIRLTRLPKAFEGFRIAQLSDFHISPFMPADEIRRYVTITNQLKPDLVVMTGDFVAWDPAAQGEVVQVLAGLRALCGVFGCLGNHETITQTEDSITRLFGAQGIHILRQERAPIQLGGDTLSLIGIDDSQPNLRVIAPLVMPDTINILLIHDQGPDGFDDAVKLGIDLTLAGHTHGGQLSLEFLHRGLCLSRLMSPYTSGWYEKPGGQLYVNRGIGTTMLPIRLGARPEITILELSRS
jgi:uncharacterized protein